MAPATNPAPVMPADATSAIDLAVIGAGPAALTAALYAARAGLSVTVFERGTIGGALAEISHISNFPGFDGSGPDLAKTMRSQAEHFGAHVEYGACTDLQQVNDHLALTIDGEPRSARAVLVATGSEPRPLDPALQSALTVPISYCALCDGDLIKGKRIAVVGGANSALQESLYLADLATSVTIISHSAIKASPALQERVAATTNIETHSDTEPTAELLNQFEHVFVYIGKRPATAFLQSLSASHSGLLDSAGYIETTTPVTHATAVPGLFVAGDVRAGALRQAVTAAADGAAAAVEIAEYLKNSQN